MTSFQIDFLALCPQFEIILTSTHIACLHNQNPSGFFVVPAFNQPIRAI